MSKGYIAVNNENISPENQLLADLKDVYNNMQYEYKKTVKLVNDCIQAMEKNHHMCKMLKK